MKILGISGSRQKDRTLERLIKEVLKGANCKSELISLKNKNYSSTNGFPATVESDVGMDTNDLEKLQEKIREADAYVIGAQGYYSAVPLLTDFFKERSNQLRNHHDGKLETKFAVAVGLGCDMQEPPVENVRRFLKVHRIECIGTILTLPGPAFCTTCQLGKNCKVKPIHDMLNANGKRTPGSNSDYPKLPDCTIVKAREYGKELSRCIKTRTAVLAQ